MFYNLNTSYIWNRPHLFTTSSTISSALNFCFFYVFYRNLKENDHIKRNINSKKIQVYIGNQYIIIWVCRKLESAWPVQQKIKLPYLRLIGLQKLVNTDFHELIWTHVHGFCYIMFHVSTAKHLNWRCKNWSVAKAFSKSSTFIESHIIVDL